MRAGILVVGIVLLVIGAVLIIVPIIPQGSLPVNTAQTIVTSGAITGMKITSPFLAQTLQITWSSNVQGSFGYGVCNELPSQSNFNKLTCSTNGTQSGTGGTVTVSATNNNYVILFFFPSQGNTSSATATAKITMPEGGIILVVVGLLLAIVGAAMKNKSKVPPVQPQAAPSETGMNPPK